MGVFKKYAFAKGRAVKHNTFIGGISGIINTPALLAAKLGIDVSRVKSFEVRGTDVGAHIVGNYVAPVLFLSSIESLTYFEDNSGLITSNSGKMFQRSYNIKKAYLPGMTLLNGNSGNWTFENNDNLANQYSKWKTLYIGNALNIGATQGFDSNVFRVGVFGFNNTIRLYAHESLATSNAGGVEGDLAGFDSMGGNSVQFIANLTKPNKVTTLSIGTKTATSLQLIFTTPTSLNTIDHYDVYIGGFWHDRISGSGQYITDLTTATLYKRIEVRAIDIYYNRAEQMDDANMVEAMTL